MEIITNIIIFLQGNKTNILLAGLCILMTWLIINWFKYLTNNYFILQGTNNTNNTNIVEGYEANTYSTLAYDNPNTPLTTHSVDLPLNTNYSCSNVCGPKATCSKSGQQCSTDVDCYNVGCQSLLKPPSKKQVENVEDGPAPADDAGILTYNQALQFSSLTTDLATNAGIIDENATIQRGYEGIPVWEDTYNTTAQIIDNELAHKYSADPEKYASTPHYKTTQTATGLFYDIGPTASNSTF